MAKNKDGGTAIEAEALQCLTFFMDEEEYALELLRVKEIMEYREPTVVPMTPASVRGVINVRGSVVPIVDLAIKFGLADLTISKRTCIIIVEVHLDGEDTSMGLVVDAVNEVRDFKADEIEDPPSFGTKVRVDYLKGMGRTTDKFALMLDIDKVLSDMELEAIKTVADDSEAE
ncbi:MAG: chemotaxis protein CheW [Gemmatimonadota bacterium]|nr:chemotaxis protein CheW [Gemmatimonadota bacterium]MDH5803747.1 chemotaxis protein CheW [Gemmatimonadota bacterium]